MGFGANQFKTWKAKYLPLIRESAKAALAKWEKHITGYMQSLEHRFRLDPRGTPQVFKDGEGKHKDSSYTKEFLGCLPEDFTMALKVQYQAAADERLLMSEAQRAKLTWDFYDRGEWGTLSKLARYWREFPAGSIACERSFSWMRDMDSPKRRKMGEDALRREMFFRCNKWVLEGMLEEVMKRLKNPNRKRGVRAQATGKEGEHKET